MLSVREEVGAERFSSAMLAIVEGRGRKCYSAIQEITLPSLRQYPVPSAEPRVSLQVWPNDDLAIQSCRKIPKVCRNRRSYKLSALRRSKSFQRWMMTLGAACNTHVTHAGSCGNAISEVSCRKK